MLPLQRAANFQFPGGELQVRQLGGHQGAAEVLLGVRAGVLPIGHTAGGVSGLVQ